MGIVKQDSWLFQDYRIWILVHPANRGEGRGKRSDVGGRTSVVGGREEERGGGERSEVGWRRSGRGGGLRANDRLQVLLFAIVWVHKGGVLKLGLKAQIAELDFPWLPQRLTIP